MFDNKSSTKGGFFCASKHLYSPGANRAIWAEYGLSVAACGCGLYEFVQIFVISNGTHTKYYSNTTRFSHIKDQGKLNVREKEDLDYIEQHLQLLIIKINFDILFL